MENPFLVFKVNCPETVQTISPQLSQAGLQVVQTFELQMTQFDPGVCTCPRHGTQACNCQMSVLLVYEPGSPPASLLVHGYDGQTSFTLVDSARQSVPAGLVARLQSALSRFNTRHPGQITG